MSLLKLEKEFGDDPSVSILNENFIFMQFVELSTLPSLTTHPQRRLSLCKKDQQFYFIQF